MSTGQSQKPQLGLVLEMRRYPRAGTPHPPMPLDAALESLHEHHRSSRERSSRIIGFLIARTICPFTPIRRLPMVLTKTRGAPESRPRDNQLRPRALGFHERRRHLDSQYSRGQGDRRAGEERAMLISRGVQITSGDVPPRIPSSTSTTKTTTTGTTSTTSTAIRSRMSAIAAGRGLERVFFINPDAVQARARRRHKLDASRLRMSSVAPRGGDSTAQGNRSKEIRRGERVLRNRESAALSRKRKNNRVGELEIQVEALEEECRRLRLLAARLERDGISGNDKANPPSLATLTTATREPKAMDKVQVHTAPACVSTAPILSSAAYVGEEGQTRQVGGELLPVLPPTVVEQAWAEGGNGVESAAAVGMRVEPKAWTQDGARPFCADGADPDDVIDRLFAVLMAEEASEREEERGAATCPTVGAGGELLQCGKEKAYAPFDDNCARKGMLTSAGSVDSVCCKAV